MSAKEKLSFEVKVQPLPTEKDFHLPLRRVSVDDVCKVLFTLQPPEEPWSKSIFFLESWISQFAEEQIETLKEYGEISDKELEKIRQNTAVISPITLPLYAMSKQFDQYAKMSDSYKEERLFEKWPDRLKARFKGNASNRNARDVSDVELAIAKAEQQAEEKNGNDDFHSLGEVVRDLLSDNPPDYIKQILNKRK